MLKLKLGTVQQFTLPHLTVGSLITEQQRMQVTQCFLCTYHILIPNVIQQEGERRPVTTAVCGQSACCAMPWGLEGEEQADVSNAALHSAYGTLAHFTTPSGSDHLVQS